MCFANQLLHRQRTLLLLLKFHILNASFESEHLVLESLKLDERKEGLHDVLVDLFVCG
jgi:hypothetical protein